MDVWQLKKNRREFADSEPTEAVIDDIILILEDWEDRIKALEKQK